MNRVDFPDDDDEPNAFSSNPLDPPEIEGLTFVRHLGEGGYSSVYLYERQSPRMRLAIKVLKTSTLSTAELAQFAAEAEAMAELADHPFIVQVFSTGQTSDGRPYMAMKFYPKPNLASRAAASPLSVSDTLRTGIQIASAVETAHRAGILHRDIKPANILVSQYGDPGLTDFGIAGHAHKSNLDDDLAISVPWAPPEVLSGASNGSIRSDIYSLCATLWHLLAGRAPFEVAHGDNSMIALFARILRDSPDTTGRADVPNSLERLLAAGMSKEPSLRPRSALDLAKELQAIEQQLRLTRTEIIVPEVNDESPSYGYLFGQSIKREQLPPQVPPKLHEVSEHTVTCSTGPVPRPPVKSTVQPTAPTQGDGAANLGSEAWTPPQEALLERYFVLETLGRGQSGTLYKGYDLRRGSFVAVKFLNAPNHDVQFRLERGGRVWLNLSHPNIAKVHDVLDSTEDLPPIIIGEYIDGISLADYCEKYDLSMLDAIRVIGQLCEALGYLHDQGIVHREVNQRNVMLSTRRPLRVTLLDSGVARPVNPAIEAFTKTGVFVGDLAYAAPEQLSGSRVTQQADIWALAALLYDLVCLKPRPRNPKEWRPSEEDLGHLPSRLKVAIRKGLSTDLSERYKSVRDLQREIGFTDGPKAQRHTTTVVALHGIRTHAAWQRSFSEVAFESGIATRFDRWNFGYFSLVRFASPWSRAGRIRWFRETYQTEFGNLQAEVSRPSIVAHSFGTYILGYALLRYPYLRFDKVLLCGSILPCNFPWGRLLERGQVGELRNEYGIEDFWTKSVSLFVPRTGPSGLRGFLTDNHQVDQEEFRYTHSEYFERSHMTNYWVPFFSMPERLSGPLAGKPVEYRPKSQPWILWVTYAVLLVGAVLILLATF